MKEADIKKQLEELRKRQEAAMRQMQQAAADLELRKVGDTASVMALCLPSRISFL
jgi:hypothetical protein